MACNPLEQAAASQDASELQRHYAVMVIAKGRSSCRSVRILRRTARTRSFATFMLTLTSSTSSTDSSGNVHVRFVATNKGGGTAVMPRIEGRLEGAGCADPFAFRLIDNGGAIPPASSVSGEFVIPGGCGGIPAVFVGADPPLIPAIPDGWSIRGAEVTYTADGAMHFLSLRGLPRREGPRPVLL